MFTADNGGNIHFPSRVQDGIELNNILFTVESVLKKMKNLNPNSSSGSDGIHNLFLINTQAVISKPLAFPFEYIFHARKIPDAWRNGNITPIFKKGKSTESSNYRPISLTSNCCKVMESIIKDQLLDYLKSNNLISRQQHGFFIAPFYVHTALRMFK